jgi:hypothetical protein
MTGVFGIGAGIVAGAAVRALETEVGGGDTGGVLTAFSDGAAFGNGFAVGCGFCCGLG